MTDIQEIKDRCRRMETRLTKFLELQGFDTKSQKPRWEDGVIWIPSIHCSVEDILNAIPSDWNSQDEIVVTHKGTDVMTLYKPT